MQAMPSLPDAAHKHRGILCCCGQNVRAPCCGCRGTPVVHAVRYPLATSSTCLCPCANHCRTRSNRWQQQGPVDHVACRFFSFARRVKGVPDPTLLLPSRTPATCALEAETARWHCPHHVQFRARLRNQPLPMRPRADEEGPASCKAARVQLVANYGHHDVAIRPETICTSST